MNSPNTTLAGFLTMTMSIISLILYPEQLKDTDKLLLHSSLIASGVGLWAAKDSHSSH